MADDALTPQLERLLTLSPEEVEQLSEQGRKDRAYAITLSLEATEPRFNHLRTRTSKVLPRAVASLAVKQECAEDAHRRHSVSSYARGKSKKSKATEEAKVRPKSALASGSKADKSGDTSPTCNSVLLHKGSYRSWKPSAGQRPGRSRREPRTEFYERLLGLGPDEVEQLHVNDQEARRYAIKYGRITVTRTDAPTQEPAPQPKGREQVRQADARAAMTRHLDKLGMERVPISSLQQQDGLRPSAFDAAAKAPGRSASPREQSDGAAHVDEITEPCPGQGQKRLRREPNLVSAGQVGGEGGKATVIRGPPTVIYPPSMPVLAQSRPKACKPEVINLVDDDSSDCLMDEDDGGFMDLDEDDGSSIATRTRRSPRPSSSSIVVTITGPLLTPNQPCVGCKAVGGTCNFMMQRRICILCKLHDRKCVFD